MVFLNAGMTSKQWAAGIGVVSIQMIFFPKSSGVLEIDFLKWTVSENRIVGAVFFVGALILWYLPEKPKE